MKKQIAIIEDDQALLDNYISFFERHGYLCKGFTAADDAVKSLAGMLPDVLILDIGLGDDYDAGFELCRYFRQASKTLPIIFLTGREEDVDVISGLRLGADDYVVKSVSLPQLLARVTALLRRTQVNQSTTENEKKLCIGDLNINPNTVRAYWKDKYITLTLTEFWILHTLVKRPGNVKSRDELMSCANTVVDNNTITSHVKRIRSKIKDLDPSFNAIETVYGLGYRWNMALAAGDSS